jgi:hypothetical protein
MTATTKPSLTELDRLRAALQTVAELVVVDPVYAPIFARLEAEIDLEESKLSSDVIVRARALAAQSATA